MRRLLLAAALLLPAVPASAAVFTDTTGTQYSTDRVTVPLVFPVAGGQTSYSDTFLTCRSGCARKHMGQDLMGPKMTPLVAAFNGTVTSLQRESRVGEGNYLVITGDNGWSAMYLHVNNDTPGTDDGRGTAKYAFPRGIEVGTRVLAGQLVAWRGDSGNAETTGPHLHFELRKGSGWSGTAYDAFFSLQAASRIARPVASGPHPDGSLLASPTGQLLLQDDGTKRLVTPGVAAADGLNPASAIAVSAQELRLLRTLGPLPLRDGALVSDPDGAAWRVVAGTRYAVTPVAGQRVVPVAATDLAGLTVVDAPAGPTTGMLVRWQGQTYRVGDDGLQLVDRYVMASWGWTAADVVDLVLPTPDPLDPVQDPVLGSPVGLRDGTLVAASGVGSGVVSHGVLRRLWDAAETASYGYTGKPRLNVPASLVNGLGTGEIAGRRWMG